MAADEEGLLPNTLTPNENPTQSQSQGASIPMVPWGRLIPYKNYLQSVDLVESFVFGRGEDCSTAITASSMTNKKFLVNISKKHFELQKCSDDNLVYILDHSKNGTFINKEKIGCKKRKILNNNDEIAVSIASNTIYKFLTQGVEAVEEFLPAELMGRFANIRRLGSGSCGEVRLVKDRNTFKEYAIKKILLSESNSSQIHKINHPRKVDNEILLLSQLSHPCVVSMSDIFRLDREVYLVLEYMAGGELTKRVYNYPMTEELVKFYFIQMVQATHYLHSCGVIHRDLKPENILLLDNDKETLLKITDFGLSKVTEKNYASTMCGTLRYVAPEVINHMYRDDGEYGNEVDLWSLGVILFFMLSREFPFKGEENSIMAKNIIKGNYDFSSDVWCDVKNDAKDLIKRILQPKPTRRISLSGIVEHQWIRNDYDTRWKVEKLLRQAGILERPMQGLTLERSPKKFKLSNSSSLLTFSSSSEESNESNTTLTNVNVNGSSSYSSSPTICC